MKLNRLTACLLLPVALVAAGCGGGDDNGAAGEPVPTPAPIDDSEPGDSIDGAWILTSGSLDGAELVLVDGRDVTMNIDGGQIGGTAACNGYGGTLDVGDESELGGSFVVGELGWTEMGCESEVMDLEQRFLAALDGVDSYELATTLSLAREGAQTSLEFEPVVPVDDTELVGTTWVLDTVIIGDAASNWPGMDAAFLKFSDDGTVVGSTGCRALDGEWSLQGATIQIPILTAIDDPTAGACAPESNALDGAFIAVIESGMNTEIDGTRLTLTAPGGDGLSFQAGEG